MSPQQHNRVRHGKPKEPDDLSQERQTTSGQERQNIQDEARQAKRTRQAKTRQGKTKPREPDKTKPREPDETKTGAEVSPAELFHAETVRCYDRHSRRPGRRTLAKIPCPCSFQR